MIPTLARPPIIKKFFNPKEHGLSPSQWRKIKDDFPIRPALPPPAKSPKLTQMLKNQQEEAAYSARNGRGRQYVSLIVNR
jgi:hypothetical protein